MKLHPYRQHTVFKRAHQKLASRVYGPFTILKKIGAVAYKLQLPKTTNIHPVFHVFLLKPYVGDPPQVPQQLPSMTNEGFILLEPLKILDVRRVKRCQSFHEEWLILWKHISAEDATWEPKEVILQQFPSLEFEDKHPYEGGGIVRPNPRRSSRVPRPNKRYLN